MTKTTKYAIVPALVLLCLFLPGALRADTLYTYQGNPYNNSCTGTYTCPGPGSPALSITFTTNLTGAALNNLSPTNISAFVTSFTVTDGTGLIITQANASSFFFFIATGPTGLIQQWAISAIAPTSSTTLDWAQSCSSPYIASCVLGFNNAAIDISITNTTLNLGPNTGAGANIPGPGIPQGVWSPPTTVVSAVPEPSSLVLLGTGLAGLVGMELYKKRFA